MAIISIIQRLYSYYIYYLLKKHETKAAQNPNPQKPNHLQKEPAFHHKKY